jgi:hypothetical protein
VGLLFSSCLGDNRNVIEKNEDFVYITTIDGVKAGAISYYPWTYITTEQITQKGEVNQFYIMGYKIDLKNIGGGGKYYIAEDMGPVAKKIEQTRGRATAPSVADNEFYPTTFGVAVWNPANSLYNDRWVFYAQASLKEEGRDFPKMYFYYDPANQKEGTDKNNDGVISEDEKEEIGENKMIIDIKFDTESFSEGQKNARNFYAVGDLSDIRNYFLHSSGKLNYNGEKYVYVPIKFRYRKAVKDSNNQDTTVEVSDGNWNTDSTGKYALYFTTETGN